MRIRNVAKALGPVFLGVSLALPLQAAKLEFPQTRAATYDEIREYQALGRIVTAPDGSFFLYEWSRPYNWAPDVSWLHPSARPRTQTLIYRVDTHVSPERPDTAVTSKYAFYQDPNSTYYLGALSPDNQRMTFYRINHDDENVRAGVVTFDDPIRPTVAYFDAPPDDAKLHLAPVWTSSDEFIYAAKSGLVRATVPPKIKIEDMPIGQIVGDKPTKTTPCTGCAHDMLEKAAAAAEQVSKSWLAQISKQAEKKPANSWDIDQKPAAPPKNATAIARSQNAELSIYAIDTPEVLSLLFIKSDGTLKTLFENERKPGKVANTRE